VAVILDFLESDHDTTRSPSPLFHLRLSPYTISCLKLLHIQNNIHGLD